MSSHKTLLAGTLIAASLVFPALGYEFGRPPTADEIKAWNIDVLPDGTGLPDGGGTVARGKQVYQDNCEGCHGPNGVGGIKDRLAGGQGTLATDRPIKTVGSYWPYATTLFDYIRRAMPYPSPGSLSADDTYAVAAYILNWNALVPADATLDKKSLPKIQMPNRNGFIPEPEFAKLIPKSEKEGP
jgi:S-disulfanyl-L-cysteine oxidoreductase SoxD